MRAVVVNELKNQIVLEGEAFHHLSVVRVRLGEKILILDGKGGKALAEIVEISKKEILLSVLEKTQVEPRAKKVGLAFILPKKDASEEIVRVAIQMGADFIQPLLGEFSQFDWNEKFVNERLLKLMESSLIQSNNPFFPQIGKLAPLKDWGKNKKINYFHPEGSGRIDFDDEITWLLLGPEAGFSENELAFLSEHRKVTLDCPIMTAPVAAAAALAIFHSQR